MASRRSFPWYILLAAAAAVGSVGLDLPLASAANPTPQQIKNAADEFDRGVKAAKAGNLDEAASHFEAADREAPSPEALKASIRARRDANQGPRASTLAAQALTRYPSNTELVDFAKGVIAQFGGKLHKVSVSCKPECLLVVDNKLAPGEAAAESVLYLDAGKHSVSAGWGDKNVSKEVTAVAGGSSSLSFAPPKAETPAASASAAPAASAPKEPGKEPAAEPSDSAPEGPAPTPGKGLSPAFTYVGIGLSVALGGASIWSGLDAQSNPGPDKVRSACVGLGESCPEYQDGLSRQRRTNILLASTGGAVALTGIVALFLTDWSGGKSTEPAASSSARRKQPAWLPGISFESGGATLHAAGRF